MKLNITDISNYDNKFIDSTSEIKSMLAYNIINQILIYNR